jgi:hypothetical protein
MFWTSTGAGIVVAGARSIAGTVTGRTKMARTRNKKRNILFITLTGGLGATESK